MTPHLVHPFDRSAGARTGLAHVLGLAVCICLAAVPATADEKVHVGFIGTEPPDREPVSLLDSLIADEGVQGARLAVDDNNATGAFTGQEFVLHEVVVPREGEIADAAAELIAAGAKWIVSDLTEDALGELLDVAEGEELTVFNARAPDDLLRNEECRANLFHTTPSRGMLSDALAQFFITKRWARWALVVGNTPEDALLADALRHSAERFGGDIVGEMEWPHTPLARRAEGGFHAIQREVPVFLQDLPDHDVLIVVDETDYFGEYFPFQTWQPRPVAGTQGLIAAAWHRSHESWGAVQLHRRFEQQAGRWMTPRDFAAWVAVRALGEAATRQQSVDREEMAEYLLDERFELGAYLGDPVTFRGWDRQLRQPVLVTGPRMVVSVSPQEGFLHPTSPLDSLGSDEPESACEAN